MKAHVRAGAVTRYLRLDHQVPAGGAWRVLEVGLILEQTYIKTLKKELKATYGPSTSIKVKTCSVRIGGAVVSVPLIAARQKRLDVAAPVQNIAQAARGIDPRHVMSRDVELDPNRPAMSCEICGATPEEAKAGRRCDS